MKSLKRLLCIACLAFAACEESTEMLTVMHTDGTFYRELTGVADKEFMTGDTADSQNPFPVVVDENWQVTWQYGDKEPQTIFPITQDDIQNLEDDIPESEARKFKVKIHRIFKSIDDLSSQFTLKPSHSWTDMEVRYHAEKKFRFFYTYYQYQEIYPQISSDFPLPIEQFMDKEEALFWFNGTPELTNGMNGLEMSALLTKLEQQYERWLTFNLWEMRYSVVIDHYDCLPQSAISKEDIIHAKDTILKINISQSLDIDMQKCMNEYFKTDIFSSLWEMENSPMDAFDEQFEQSDFVRSQQHAFLYKLVMPGEVLSSNGVRHGDTLQWNLTAARFLLDDFTLEAQSRKLNVWMILIIAGLFITTIIAFVAKRWK